MLITTHDGSTIRVSDEVYRAVDNLKVEIDALKTRLAEYEKVHRVLEHDVQILDLRIPDRLIIRKSSQKKADKTKSGRET